MIFIGLMVFISMVGIVASLDILREIVNELKKIVNELKKIEYNTRRYK